MPPLFVFEGEGTAPEEIKAARRKSRAVIYVRRVELGRAEIVVDRIPDYESVSLKPMIPRRV